ncbi:MAG: aldo/keto reductase [Paracoccaceae bacterium]|nr:aldo/keto reductase [Paracoccaceae bacterium]
MENKLVIGTANFGMNYGQGMDSRRLSEQTTKEILQFAQRLGIKTLDTAISYGDCSKRLGIIGIEDWKVITKIPKIPNGINDVNDWVKHCISQSAQEIGVSMFEAILIHNPKDFVGEYGKELLWSLKDLKKNGVTRKIGVSVYEKKDLETILNIFQPEIVQCPVNIVDKRLLKNKYLHDISNMGIEVHIRSIFLQGLLTYATENIPVEFARFKDFWQNWKSWLSSQKLTPVEACVRFVNSIQGIDKIVIGVNSTLHLKEIFHYFSKPPIEEEPKWGSDLETELIDPRLWNQNKT